MTTLNDTFERELAQEDEGYASGSDGLSIPTPLRRASRIYHISTNKSISFNPTTPLTTAACHSNHSSMCCHLMFSSSDEVSASPVSSLPHSITEPPSLVQHSLDYQHPSLTDTDNAFQNIATNDKDEEHFPTVTLDGDLCLEDPVPDRHLCIHEHLQPHFLCSYPCPYGLDPLPYTPIYAPALYCETLDLSDFSDFQDVMTTTSDEDIPDLDDIFGL